YSDSDGIIVSTLLADADGTWSFGQESHFSGLDADDANHWRAADVDGDGKIDLVHVEANATGALPTTARTLLSTGSATAWVEETSHPEVHDVDAARWFPADLNGDGRVDLAHVAYDAGDDLVVVTGLLSRGNGLWSPIADPSARVAGSDVGFDAS